MLARDWISSCVTCLRKAGFWGQHSVNTRRTAGPSTTLSWGGGGSYGALGLCFFSGGASAANPSVWTQPPTKRALTWCLGHICSCAAAAVARPCVVRRAVIWEGPEGTCNSSTREHGAHLALLSRPGRLGIRQPGPIHRAPNVSAHCPGKGAPSPLQLRQHPVSLGREGVGQVALRIHGRGCLACCLQRRQASNKQRCGDCRPCRPVSGAPAPHWVDGVRWRGRHHSIQHNLRACSSSAAAASGQRVNRNNPTNGCSSTHRPAAQQWLACWAPAGQRVSTDDGRG